MTKDITLYPIGGIASFQSLPEEPVQELLVGLAGPSVNLVIAFLLWVYLKTSSQMPDLSVTSNSQDMLQTPFVFNLFIANIVLAVFNLIPAFPMDGGRVLRAILSFFTDRAKATRMAAGIGQFLAIIFVFLGFFYNFWLVFIGLFIYLGAGGEAAYEQMKSNLSGLTVKDALMHRFTVLKSDDTLNQAVDALLNSQETEFVITDNEKPVGLLTRNEIIKGLSEQGKEAPVTAFMNPNFFVVNPQMQLQDFFQEVLSKEQNVALVMDGNSLLGLIDRENIEEKISSSKSGPARNMPLPARHKTVIGSAALCFARISLLRSVISIRCRRGPLKISLTSLDYSLRENSLSSRVLINSNLFIIIPTVKIQLFRNGRKKTTWNESRCFRLAPACWHVPAN